MTGNSAEGLRGRGRWGRFGVYGRPKPLRTDLFELAAGATRSQLDLFG
jgi:hypothetical protein